MEKETVVFLLQKHIAGTLTEGEKSELAGFINKNPNKELTIAALEELLLQETGNNEFDETRYMPLISGILKSDIVTDEDTTDLEISKHAPVHGSRKKRIWWVLILLAFAAAVTLYIYYFKPFDQKAEEKKK